MPLSALLKEKYFQLRHVIFKNYRKKELTQEGKSIKGLQDKPGSRTNMSKGGDIYWTKQT